MGGGFSPNWFGAEIAHKSVVLQTSFEKELVTHLSSEGFCWAQGNQTFSEFKKKKKRDQKDLKQKRLFKNIFQNDLAIPDTSERRWDIRSATDNACVCFTLEPTRI